MIRAALIRRRFRARSLGCFFLLRIQEAAITQESDQEKTLRGSLEYGRKQSNNPNFCQKKSSLSSLTLVPLEQKIPTSLGGKMYRLPYLDMSHWQDRELYQGRGCFHAGSREICMVSFLNLSLFPARNPVKQADCHRYGAGSYDSVTKTSGHQTW